MKIIDKIPKDLLDKYLNHEITSIALAEIIQCHPHSLRRAVKRPPRPNRAKQKQRLRQLREQFHESIAHLSLREIMKQAHVSKTTAWRIQQRYKK